MDHVLAVFAEKISLNTSEAFLNIELNNGICKLLVIERGTGGCTFPQMELLHETPLGDISLFSSLTQSDAFLQEILSAKTKMHIENPYFFDTVFFSSESETGMEVTS